MIAPAKAEPSAAVAVRVGAARKIQRERYIALGQPQVRTLADLAQSDRVARPHVAEALSYRLSFATT